MALLLYLVKYIMLGVLAQDVYLWLSDVDP